ncbi:MAG: DUF1566 domain-containing protein, partial [Myxococcaceae bacterium]|nr:DUF1566 domain-containing protein [Myxococcaceae bacterium]
AVRDLFTGLIWEKTISSDKLVWSRDAEMGSAQAYCVSLSKADLDWRVPNVMELQSLVDYSEKNGRRIHPIFSSDAKSQVYWTSVSFKGYSEVLGLRMDEGVLESLSADSKQRVRCVSGFRNAMSFEYTNNTPDDLEAGNISVGIGPHDEIAKATICFCDSITGLRWAPKSFQCLSRSKAAA